MSDLIPDQMSDNMSVRMPDRMPEYMSDRMPERMPDTISEYVKDNVTGDHSKNVNFLRVTRYLGDMSK